MDPNRSDVVLGYVQESQKYRSRRSRTIREKQIIMLDASFLKTKKTYSFAFTRYKNKNEYISFVYRDSAKDEN